VGPGRGGGGSSSAASDAEGGEEGAASLSEDFDEGALGPADEARNALADALRGAAVDAPQDIADLRECRENHSGWVWEGLGGMGHASRSGDRDNDRNESRRAWRGGHCSAQTWRWPLMAAGPFGIKRLTVCRSESGSHSRTTPMPAMAPELLGRPSATTSGLHWSVRKSFFPKNAFGLKLPK
jgi:hypothetical protein